MFREKVCHGSKLHIEVPRNRIKVLDQGATRSRGST